jgi:hypothetical protein
MQFSRCTGPEIASQKEHPILDMTYGLWDYRRAISDDEGMI